MAYRTLYVSVNDLHLMQIRKPFKHLFCVPASDSLYQWAVQLDLVLYRALQHKQQPLDALLAHQLWSILCLSFNDW